MMASSAARPQLPLPRCCWAACCRAGLYGPCALRAALCCFLSVGSDVMHGRSLLTYIRCTHLFRMAFIVPFLFQLLSLHATNPEPSEQSCVPSLGALGTAPGLQGSAELRGATHGLQPPGRGAVLPTLLVSSCIEVCGLTALLLAGWGSAAPTALPQPELKWPLSFFFYAGRQAAPAPPALKRQPCAPAEPYRVQIQPHRGALCLGRPVAVPRLGAALCR